MTAHSKKRKFYDGGALLEKTKARVARKQAGIEDREEPTYLGSVKDVLKGYKDKAVAAVTPGSVKVIKDATQRQQDALDAADDTNVPGKKKGGKIKPRGVGVAARGHGKGRMR